MTWTADQLAERCGGTLSGDGGTRVGGVSTDTRDLGRGELFVAIRGPNFDGHDFARAAAESGASCLLVSEPVPEDLDLPRIRVSDTVEALGRLARAHRDCFDLPVIAITGSNGKTTTRELCAAVLEAGGARVHRSPGNLNNHIGLPLSVLGLRDGDDALLVEMGMNHAGEIAGLCEIARPTVAAITNVAPAHLGPLGSLDAIARAKGEIFEGLERSGTAVVNADDERVAAQARRFAGARIRFGRAAGCELRASDERPAGARSRFALDTPAGRIELSLGAVGLHLTDGALCAAAAAWASGLLGADPLAALRSGLEGFAGVPGRGGLLATPGGLVLIDDSYNANPHSVCAALRTLAALEGGARRVAVLGDMFELGPAEAELHAGCGRAAAEARVDLLLGVGPLSAHTARAARDAGVSCALHSEGLDGALDELRSRLRPGDHVLVKGSRGMRMERVVHALMECA